MLYHTDGQLVIFYSKYNCNGSEFNTRGVDRGMMWSVIVCLQAFSGRTRSSAWSCPRKTATTPRRPAPSFWLSCRSTRDAEESPSLLHCTCTRCTQDPH